jgi:MoaA/NifB/PqqE/SkfB family radical SAM enzyme
MSPQDFQYVLSHRLFKNVRYILNSGGEPTVRSDFYEILLAEHRALPEATLQISTNGLLPQRVLDIAAKADFKLEVGISLDGVGEDHDRIRGVKGNFTCVEKLVTGLKELKVNFSLGATLTGKDLACNLEAQEWTCERGVPFVWHWFNVSPFYDNCENDGCDWMGMRKIVGSMDPSLYRDLWLRSFSDKNPRFKCFALNSFAVLKCNGSLAPCLSLWDDNVGNVLEEDAWKVWMGERAVETRKKIADCKGCLNSWSCQWSLQTLYYPNLLYKVKHKIVR